MDSTILQADRVLLPVFVSVLVGFVTAALSIVRLVNDKESKTSDHRQQWCDSLRVCVANVVSCISSTANEVVNRTESGDQLNGLLVEHKDTEGPWPETDLTVRDHLKEVIAAKDATVRALRKDLYHAYSLTKLHFKSGDPVFLPIESNFNLAVQMLRELAAMDGNQKSSERIELKAKIHAIADNITTAGQQVLKTEWETVKRGEKIYVLTKRWSIGVGALALLVLIVFGIAAAFSISKASSQKNNENLASRNQEHDKSALPGTSSQGYVSAGFPTVNQVVNVNPVECRSSKTTTALPVRPSPPSDECGKVREK